MIDALCTYASIGATIRLGDFGSIRPALNCKSQDEAKSVTADVVYRQKLIFVPGQWLKNMMKSSGVSRMVVESEETSNGNVGSTGRPKDENDNPLG